MKLKLKAEGLDSIPQVRHDNQEGEEMFTNVRLFSTAGLIAACHSVVLSVHTCINNSICHG